jgi:hypothetical protein
MRHGDFSRSLPCNLVIFKFSNVVSLGRVCRSGLRPYPRYISPSLAPEWIGVRVKKGSMQVLIRHKNSECILGLHRSLRRLESLSFTLIDSVLICVRVNLSADSGSSGQQDLLMRRVASLGPDFTGFENLESTRRATMTQRLGQVGARRLDFRAAISATYRSSSEIGISRDLAGPQVSDSLGRI